MYKLLILSAVCGVWEGQIQRASIVLGHGNKGCKVDIMVSHSQKQIEA